MKKGTVSLSVVVSSVTVGNRRNGVLVDSSFSEVGRMKKGVVSVVVSSVVSGKIKNGVDLEVVVSSLVVVVGKRKNGVSFVSLLNVGKRKTGVLVVVGATVKLVVD